MAMTDFLNFVDNTLPRDKAKDFKTLFRFPVKSSELTASLFDKLSRVFDGRNPAHNYQFLRTEDKDDWEWYRIHVLKDHEVWYTDGWENFKTEINSVLIVDMPSDEYIDESDPRPQPYFYFLPLSEVIDYQVNRKTLRMDYIIFRQDNDLVAVIDDTSYRILEIKDKKVVRTLVENFHNLGYCPAKFFWNESLNIHEPDIKSHPMSKVLSSLDWYLFFDISKKRLDLHGAYPIYSGYAYDCDYQSEAGDSCSDGYLRNINGVYNQDANGYLAQCPKCKDKRIAGPGTFIEVPTPKFKDDVDLRKPIDILSIDSTSLKYNVEELERLKTEIVNTVIGIDESGALSEVAINELQVGASFESQTTVLNRIKKGFEEARMFVNETICRLRYGSSFVSCKINLGTEFYAINTTVLRSQYKAAKENGASETELDALQKQIIETEYRHDPTQLQRMQMLFELEPFRHLTRNEAITLYDKGIINDDEFILKMNFSGFVQKFERENINILEFGVNLPFESRIEIINKTLRSYANSYERRAIGPGEGQQRQLPSP